LIQDWQNQATKGEDQIKAWWERWPEANIGLPTGKASRFWVLDIDGEEGFRSIREFDDEIPRNTPRLKTPSGGLHLHFEYDERAEELGNTVKRIPGLGVRTQGGYVLASGSVGANGKEYEYFKSHRKPTKRLRG
jgi:hypothetical protein